MSFTDLFVLLVIRHKVMTMTEFYEADAFDIQLMCDHLDSAKREALERMRTIAWAVLAPNSKKKIMPTDVLRFPWDGEAKADTVPTTKEQFDKVFKNFKKAQ